jgi:4-hydroxythreonine-4-phosphate dehydrogenase
MSSPGSSLERTCLAVTMGDPAGIGPDIALLAWSKSNKLQIPPFFVLASVELMAERVALLGGAEELRLQTIKQPEEANAVFPNALPILPIEQFLGSVEAGRPGAAHASAIIGSIEAAVAFAAEGRVAAVVTNPIAKFVLLQGGFRHAGHTQFLGELAGRHGHPKNFPVMLMASKRLMVVPVTVHVPLKEVPTALTTSRLIGVAEVTHRGLIRYFGIERPRLAICGLNPHAGEEGELGTEESEVIVPAIKELEARGIRATGPHSADALFHEAARKTYDAVLAMYHDQALIPFKTLSFEDGVNVTLGLPFIRTSPDHGTAFSLAGTGLANPTSFIEALHLAHRMHQTASAKLPQP